MQAEAGVRRARKPDAARQTRTGPKLVFALLAFAAVALALIGAGIQVTRAALSAQDHAHRVATAAGDGPFEVGQPIRANGPVVEVTGVDQLGGLSAKDLANGNHGIANQVAADQIQVQITVRVINDSTHSVTFSSRQVLLRVGAAAGVNAQSSTIPDGRLAPGTSIEGNLGFVAPRKGASLQLELPSAHGPIFVNLGRAEATPAPGEVHHH